MPLVLLVRLFSLSEVPKSRESEDCDPTALIQRDAKRLLPLLVFVLRRGISSSGLGGGGVAERGLGDAIAREAVGGAPGGGGGGSCRYSALL